jgi:hypothetical protein
VLYFHDFHWLFPRQDLLGRFLLFLLFFKALVFFGFFGVVGGRYLKNGIDQEVEVGLFVADAEVEVLVNLVESLGVDALGEVGVLFGPVLEDEFEVGADADGLFKQFVIFLIEVEFQTVGHQH